MVEQDDRRGSQGRNSGHEGSRIDNIEELLLHELIPITATWHRQTMADNAALDLGRIHHRPALLLWGRYDASGKRNGGHFTVAARVTKAGDAVVLDPWDGTIAELPRAARYKGSYMLDVAVYTG